MAPATGALRVLLVEDVVTNQKLAKAVLARMDTVVDVASDGVEATQLFESNPTGWDVILMARHPVFERLQNCGRKPQPPGVARICGYGRSCDKILATGRGACCRCRCRNVGVQSADWSRLLFYPAHRPSARRIS